MNEIRTPASRLTDPITSFIAESEMNRGKRFTHQETIYEFVKALPGRTSAELAFYSGLERHECSRRLSDLDGIKIKKGEPKKCFVKGSLMVTWEAI